MRAHVPVDRFTSCLEVELRLAREEDLPQLEWFGLFTAHREIIRDAYERQLEGKNLMLVAVAGGFTIGQAWLDLERRSEAGGAFLWAVRVFPALRGMGLGTRLLRHAERVLAARRVRFAEIGVEKHNVAARRLYERLGYECCGELRESYEFRTPDGRWHRVSVDEWIMRKRLAPAARSIAAGDAEGEDDGEAGSAGVAAEGRDGASSTER